MSKQNVAFVSFNHGLVSRLSLARIDIARMRFAAEIQTNYVPRTVGPMTLRPGLQYIGETQADAYMQPIPFVFAVDSASDKAIIEMTAGKMRVRVQDALVTRTGVSTTITNGTFATGDLTGWTTVLHGDAIAAVINNGTSYDLHLQASGLGAWVTATQAVTVAAGDINKEHGLRVNVGGPAAVRIRVGTASGADDLIVSTLIGEGEHALAFTPGATTFYVQFESKLRHTVVISDVSIDAAGTLELTTPFTVDDLDLLRWTQSGDVIYLASGKNPRKIERRSTHSWSFVKYQPEDGPFKPLSTADVLLTPTDTFGNIGITSDVPFFTQSMVGSLLRFTNEGQRRHASLSAEDTFTEPIRVTGVHNPDNFAAGGRIFNLSITGTFVGTLSLQRSFDGPDTGFEDVDQYSGAESPLPGEAIVDEFDNSIAWYRIGFKGGDYTSGTANVQLIYGGGGGSGVVYIASVASSTSAGANVFKELSAAAATRDWQEGEWSDKYGYPSTVELFEGRLWWMGLDRFWGTVSDAYESHDVTFQGDAGPIQRSIGYGPVEKISWALALQRLMVGTGYSEISARSSSFDEPLTPTNFGLRDASTQGCSRVGAVKVDTRGIFVTRSKRRVYQLLFEVNNGDYSSNDLTALLPDIGTDLKKLAVQRHPDTRIHVVRGDGKAMVLLFEPSEEVICWYLVETDGIIENVVVLPEDVEDRVYYVVKRTINGSTKRYLEKFTRLDQNNGQPAAYLADAYKAYTGLSSATITGLDHLAGEDVVVWAWDNSDTAGTDFSNLGEDPPTYTVTGGAITIPSAKQNVVVGLPYTAQFRSAKLAYAAPNGGTALIQKKRIDHVGFILVDTHGQGVEFGQAFDDLDPLPQTFKGATIAANKIYDEYDQPSVPCPGEWDTDARLCLQSQAPRPASILAAVIAVTTNEKP